jgi:hypothetical protein
MARGDEHHEHGPKAHVSTEWREESSNGTSSCHSVMLAKKMGQSEVSHREEAEDWYQVGYWTNDV